MGKDNIIWVINMPNLIYDRSFIGGKNAYLFFFAEFYYI